MPPKVAGTVRSKNPLKGAVEVLPQRLYYAALKSPLPSHNILASTPRRKKSEEPAEKKQIHFFNIDNELVYWNFFLDFGPLNLGQLTRFCYKLNDKLRKFPVVCFYSSALPAKRANAIFLICAWQMLFLGRSPEESYRGFNVKELGDYVGSYPPVSSSQGAITIEELPPFHDASPCACTYDLTVLDCLQGLARGMDHGFYDIETFDLEEYEHYEQVENGDMNWILKGKIIAFAGPSYERHISPEGYCTLSPQDYIPYFLKNNVSLVVRLNKKMYHEQDFVDAGINHVEAFFIDGSCPPMKILHGVIEAFESVPADKAFAVHCKAGLGRTGSVIGGYLMKHYRFTASEAIAWMRICRPGCVIGPQQHFLKKIEPLMWQEGIAAGYIERPRSVSSDKFRVEDGDEDETPNSPMVTESESAENDAVMPDASREGQQADGLLAARGRRQTPKSDDKRKKEKLPTPPITPEQTKGPSAVTVTPEQSQVYCA